MTPACKCLIFLPVSAWLSTRSAISRVRRATRRSVLSARPVLIGGAVIPLWYVHARSNRAQWAHGELPTHLDLRSRHTSHAIGFRVLRGPFGALGSGVLFRTRVLGGPLGATVLVRPFGAANTCGCGVTVASPGFVFESWHGWVSSHRWQDP